MRTELPAQQLVGVAEPAITGRRLRVQILKVRGSTIGSAAGRQIPGNAVGGPGPVVQIVRGEGGGG